jgi:hypothetical protein
MCKSWPIIDLFYYATILMRCKMQNPKNSFVSKKYINNLSYKSSSGNYYNNTSHFSIHNEEKTKKNINPRPIL